MTSCPVIASLSLGVETRLSTTRDPMPTPHPNRRSLPSDGARGFNLVEILVVLALIGLIATMTLPTFSRILQRERIEGFLRTASVSLERAKGEAAKRGVPAVVRADFDNDALYAFADLDRDGMKDLADPELFYLALPSLGDEAAQSLRFWAVGDAEPEKDGAVFGFSADPTPGDFPNQVVLEPDGSARAAGAFRFGLKGTPGNFYELRVEPAATARVQLRKYVWTHSPPAFLARNPNESATWPWF